MVEYRGWKIEYVEGTQVNYSASIKSNNKRKAKWWEIHYPDSDNVKVVDTLKQAKEYIDNYLS